MKSTRYLSLIIPLSLALTQACALAQGSAPPKPSMRVRSGITGAATINMHRGDFVTYDGILECGLFQDATTLGWQGGYIFELPFNDALGLSTRLAYWKADGSFTGDNPLTARVAIDDNTTVPLTTEQTLDASLDYLQLDLLGTWRFAGPLYVAAGPTIALPTRAAYQQTERIVSPQGITFDNGQSSRKIIAGNFDQQGTLTTRRNIRIAATGAIGAEIDLSDRLVLAPEVAYSFGFTSVLSSFDWKVNALRAGASLMYAFGGESRADTMAAPAAAPTPVMAFDLHNQLADGTRLAYAKITEAEERASDVIPLLPYLFFSPNSSQLPARYATLSGGSETGSFDEGTLRDSVLGVYHHILDVVGRRMQIYPEATISITGCREPLDDTSSNNALSQARAEAVKSYLVSTWKIAPDRIRTSARALPATLSYRATTDGREENRRAELRSSDPRILAPVTRRFTTTSLEPSAIALVPAIQFGDGIADWHLAITSRNGAMLHEERGHGAPASDIIWHLSDDALAPAAGDATITARLEATTSDGTTLRAERAIPVEKVVRSRRFNGEIVHDSLVERYSMIFFDYDTPHISDFNEQVVRLIQSRMRTNSSVNITGLTDRVGDEPHNLELSARRASAGADELRSRIVPEQIHEEGAGEHLIYNNDLPEGRMYNRTVIVEIATPTE
jgi:outer membrane protein OmpA-like peptidoglycan-associated protein